MVYNRNSPLLYQIFDDLAKRLIEVYKELKASRQNEEYYAKTKDFSKRKEPDQQLSYRIKQQNLSQRDLPTSYGLPDITHGQEHNHPH